MPIIISGSTGISGVDGTASSPALQGADTDTGVFYPAANQVAIATGGVQRVLVNASGAITSTAGATFAGTLSFDSGYGSAAVAYGCRAWVNFDGTGTVAIRASGNVTSITDNGTGLYTINFTTALPDTNYAISGLCLTEARYVSELGTRTTSSVQVVVANATPSRFDNSIVMVAVFR
jgi:hypothetical protein